MSEPMTVLAGLRIVTPNGVIDNGYVRITDGRIARETRIYGPPFEPPAWRTKYAD